MNGMIQIPSVDRRLSAALAFARQGKIPLDVGTDHAFLPILLLLRGLCPRAVASDVNAGPLARAEQMVLAGEIEDAKTQIAILKYTALRRKGEVHE